MKESVKYVQNAMLRLQLIKISTSNTSFILCVDLDFTNKIVIYE
jgi:hypothetical protein